jgi:hypothetical protein
MAGFYKNYQDSTAPYTASAAESARQAEDAAERAEDAADSIKNQGIDDVVGLQSALDDKVDDPQVLTNVPQNAVFTDTTYSNVSEFNNDENYLSNVSPIQGGTF